MIDALFAAVFARVAGADFTPVFAASIAPTFSSQLRRHGHGPEHRSRKLERPWPRIEARGAVSRPAQCVHREKCGSRKVRRQPAAADEEMMTPYSPGQLPAASARNWAGD
jgi:hypothetical protein